jgi:hypothetical protein
LLLKVLEHQELLEVHGLEVLLLELRARHAWHERLLPVGDGGEVQVARGLGQGRSAGDGWLRLMLCQGLLLEVELEELVLTFE